MHKVWIFGDSFSDPNYRNRYLLGPDPSSWPNKLAKRYNVQNRSIEGSGPDYALKLLLNDINTTPLKVLKSVQLIFLQSDVHRFNFVGIYKDDDPKQQVYAKTIASGIHKNQNATFIKNMFRHYAVDEWEGREQLKFYSTINSIAHNFKQVAYITVGGFHPIYLPIIKPVENLTLVPSNLMSASMSEPETTNELPDPRPNHFSSRTHDYIFNHLCDWIDGRKDLNFNQLEKVAANK